MSAKVFFPLQIIFFKLEFSFPPQVMSAAFKHKSPKVQEAALNWLAVAVNDFGFLWVEEKEVG